MSNQKQQKPMLSGQCFKTRKKHKKETFDPTQLQDCIIQGLTETSLDLEAVTKLLYASGAKRDYHRYAETLFDILVAGEMLAPSGTVADDMMCTDVCVFAAQEDLETMCYKYPEKGGPPHLSLLLLFLKGFSESERNKLAMLTGVHLNLVKEGVSAAFAVNLRKISMDNRQIELLSANKQSIEHFTEYFTEAGLKELSEYQTIRAHKELQKELQEQMSCGPASNVPKR
uniref:5MP1/2-like HEAT domain-containing protein n=1 Tax=Aotus nancymaae TaxID=37293 RepID=A0A2K5DSP2_AOTNA